MFKVFYYKFGKLSSIKYKYINKKNFKITKNKDDAIKIESLIANSISLLNQKGYLTYKSSSGYVKIYSLIEVDDPTGYEEASFDDYSDYKNKELCSTENITLIRNYDNATVIKIFFDEAYKFDTLPEGFVPQYSSEISIMDNIVFKFHEKGIFDIDKITLDNYYNNRVTKLLKVIDLNNKNEKQIYNELLFEHKKLFKWTKKLKNKKK